MPFICLRRSDIQNGVLQVTDLWPNASQRNQSIDPKPQGPRYVSAPVTSTVVLGSTGATQRFLATAQGGLAAYLIANVQVGAGGPALTPAQADTAAAALIVAMVGGAVLNLAAINAILTAAAAGATLTGNASTGAVTDVLRILSGASYTVPAGTIVQVVVSTFNPQAGPAVWNANNFNFNAYKDILVSDSSFYISLAEGQINGFSSPQFSYLGIVSPAIVVYDNAGAVL
jgi:hypothetical protein